MQIIGQSWNWRHVGVQYWREWWRLRICWVALKLAKKLGQHAGTREPHPVTRTDARGLKRRDQYNWLTNGTVHPTQWTWSYGSHQRWDFPGRKPLIQWRFTTARQVNILVPLTTDKRLSPSRRPSATPLHWGQRRRPPSGRGRPSERP